MSDMSFRAKLLTDSFLRAWISLFSFLNLSHSQISPLMEEKKISAFLYSIVSFFFGLVDSFDPVLALSLSFAESFVGWSKKKLS